MKIGIDCRLWFQTGVGRYIKNLVLELEKIDRKNDYTLFVRKDDYEEIKSMLTNSRFKLVKTGIKWHSLSEQLRFPALLNKHNLDLVHFPYFSHPVFYKKPFVITIHDLIINHFPTGKASTQSIAIYTLKWLFYQKILRHGVVESKKIIVPLEFVKNDLSRTLGVAKEKIEVITEGFDLAISKGKVAEDIERVSKNRYFLYVGNAYPHKNLEKLVEGFYWANLKDTKLIFVGKDDFFYKRLEKKKFPNLIFLHDVSDTDLYCLYSNSIAAVSASLMEGFGLLPLEAIGSGSLAVVSNIPAFNEVCKDSVIYFNPGDAHDIGEKLSLTAKLTQKERDVFIKKGKSILPNFSWEKMAEKTLEVYEAA